MADENTNWNSNKKVYQALDDEFDDDDDDVTVDIHGPDTQQPARPIRPTTAGPLRTPHSINRLNNTHNRGSSRYMSSDPNEPSTSRGSSHSIPQSDIPGSSNTSQTYTAQVEQEEVEVQQIGEQARGLLGLFLHEQFNRSGLSDNPNAQPIIRECCQAEHSLHQTGFTDENLSDIAVTLRRIGDDISRDVELNNAIERVPVKSTQDVFMKVCLKMFEDGNFNWGRVVALFYFAYRLIAKAIRNSLSSSFDGLPSWVSNVIRWVTDFIVKYVAKWIISKGGWNMIHEYLSYTKTVYALTFGALALAAYFALKKD